MAKPEQVLIIEPQNELRFRGPFTGSPVTSYMKLTNPSNNKVYFKIKTTAPKRYCVRPNSGAIKPKEVLEIAVCLQPYEFDPTEKNKHKFMVQTVLAPEGDNDDYPVDVWKDISPNQLMDSKLKCVFENPVSNSPGTKTSPDVTVKNDMISANKGTGDNMKSSPKSIGDAEEKLNIAAQEVKQLREEESRLRQENLSLREEICRWRNAAITTGKSNPGGVSGVTSNSNTLFFPTSSLILALVVAIVAFFLGKLI